MALRENFIMYAGDTYKIDVTINDLAGSPIDITAASAEFALSVTADGDPVLTKTDDIVITDGPNGKLRITLVQIDTNTLAPREYFHELKITIGGERDTVMFGNIKIKESILK